MITHAQNRPHLNRRRFLTLSACAALPMAARAAAAPAPQEWRGQAMGADVTLRLRGAAPMQARAFFAEAQRLIAHVENQFSLHRDSDLARLNLPDTAAFRANRALFPLGLDFCFTAAERLAALPRSTKVEAG